MAEVLRRLGWLVCVAACQGAAATPCHHETTSAAPILGATWTATIATVCGNKYLYGSGSACKDGSGKALFISSDIGVVWGYFNADGKLIGSRYETDDQTGSACAEDTWGTQLACDLTPIDLPCAVTN